MLPLKKSFHKSKVLITLGATREYLDAVRFLTNASSGKMGLALAEAFRSLGADVTLICGSGIVPPKHFKFVFAVSARAMLRAVQKRFSRCDVFVSCAAVSDFRPAQSIRGKMDRRDGSLNVRLVPNPDILESVTRWKMKQVVVGFALEASSKQNSPLRRARKKMVKKRCDLLVLNSLSSMEKDQTDAALLFSNGQTEFLGKISKKICAQKICKAILKIF